MDRNGSCIIYFLIENLFEYFIYNLQRVILKNNDDNNIENLKNCILSIVV